MTIPILRQLKRHPWILSALSYFLYAVLLSLITWGWWNNVQGPILKKHDTLMASNIKMEKKLSTLIGIGSIPDVEKLTSHNLMALSHVTSVLHESLAKAKGVRILDTTQGKVSWADNQQLLSVILDEDARIHELEFTVTLAGTYQGLLSFFDALDSQGFIFWETLDYQVDKHPESRIKVVFKVYGDEQ